MTEKTFKPKTLLITLLSALLRGVGVQLFLIPNCIVLGGAIGISSIVELLFPDLPYLWACYLLVLINIPLLIIARKKIGRRWSVRTMVNILATALVMWLIKFFNLATILDTTNAQHTVLYVIIGGVSSGMALPMMLNVHGSTGGSDIISVLYIRRSSSATVMRGILLMDIAISALGALLLANFNVLVFSVVALLASELVSEMMYRGYSSAILLQIVTSKPQEICEELMTQLRHGVSNLSVKGMYSNTDKTMVMCVIFKRQLTASRRLIRKIDPQAFAYVLNVKEVVGLGFRNKEEELEKPE